jgi:SAM-dependent methyltransferase
MLDWTAGYVADIGYTYGYYGELNPNRVRLAFLNAGLAFPEIGAACELGFGQGLSANVHAAASMCHWHGTDFNPAQAGFAQQLAAAADSGAQLFDQSFAEFCTRPDLPDFDFIGLHGIWSWISDENRSVIVDFIRRKLKVGGVVYISYNTLPGWAAFAPMRHLMVEHAEVLGAEGRGIVSRIDGAIDFAERLMATNPLFLRANPPVGERLNKLKEHNRHYLAHEYFNRDWHPMHFSTMATWLEPAKVQYACSAHFLDAIDAINLAADQQAFLNEIPDALFRQSVRDFMVNQQFRRDYWVKGSRRLTPLQQMEQLRQVSLLLVTPRADVSLKVSGSLGEATMTATVYDPILDLMGDHKARTLAQMEQALAPQGVTTAQLIQAAMLLVGAGHFALLQEAATVQKARRHTDKLNAHLMDQARGSSELGYLASPVTGGGVAYNRVQQLFLASLQRGQRKPEEWAQAAWAVLSMMGQRLLKNGKPLETAEANLAELTEQAQVFASKQLPLARALQIV